MHRRLIYFVGRCDHISPLLYGRWHDEAVTEGFISLSTEIHGNRRRALIPPPATSFCKTSPRSVTP